MLVKEIKRFLLKKWNDWEHDFSSCGLTVKCTVPPGQILFLTLPKWCPPEILYSNAHNFQTTGTVCRNLYRKIEVNEKSKDNSEFSNHVSRNLGQQRLMS